MRVLFCGLLSVFILLSGHTVAVESPEVYMVGRNKVTGTTYTQVVFFNSHEINTLAECETELEYGLSSGWRVYTHLLRKVKGFGYSTQYSCVELSQVLTDWVGHDIYGRMVYLVSTNNSQLTVKPIESYSACLKEVRTVQAEESHELFCGTSSQKLLK